MRGIFITGTDTNVGKTWFSVRLIHALHQYGLRVIPRKPVESGWLNEAIEQTDAYRLTNAAFADTLSTAHFTAELKKVCPYHFPAALSPPRAAQLAHQSLSIQQLKKACLTDLAHTERSDNDFYLIEGAGGFYSPLAQDGLNADLARALQLPIILVVDDKLGCINHTLLSLAAIEQYNLTTVCIFLNQRLETDNKTNDKMDNAKDLRELTPIPICTNIACCVTHLLSI